MKVLLEDHLPLLVLVLEPSLVLFYPALLLLRHCLAVEWVGLRLLLAVQVSLQHLHMKNFLLIFMLDN